jgi:hypothetical protein
MPFQLRHPGRLNRCHDARLRRNSLHT